MIKENILLKPYTNYQIGGPARFFSETSNLDELKDDLAKWQIMSLNLSAEEKKVFILGAGMNVLFNDDGFNGLVIRYKNNKIELLDNYQVKAGSNTTINELNDFLINHSLSGFEWAGGLPGTVGGAVFGNAGAFGGETKDQVKEVLSLDLQTLENKNRNNASCGFGYRTSTFKEKLAQKELILEVIFQLKTGKKEEIKKAVEEKIAYRKERQPLDLPSAGSTFKNVPVESVSEEIKNKFNDKIKNDPFPVIPAAVFLADADLKGLKVGDAQVSLKHPNFLVNIGKATASDVKELIKKVQVKVYEKYGVNLETELIQPE